MPGNFAISGRKIAINKDENRKSSFMKEMNDVDFEKVRSLLESDDKECLLEMQENCLGRNYQAEMC